jgi:hypothetical protein
MRRAAILGVLVLTAACGGGSGATAGGPPATVDAASPSSVPAAAPAALPALTPPASTTTTPCGWRTTRGYKHVIWIWMENRSYSSVLGSSTAAPNLASYGKKCGVATNYYAITHPSLPNYLAATAGTTGGVTTDCAPSSCAQSRSSLYAQVAAAGKQWRGYAESMSGNCNLTSSGRYAARHNPAVYFKPIRSQCRSWDVPMGTARSGAFISALHNKTLPAFSFVTPNLCDDGHDCSTATADRWLGSWLNAIVASAAYRVGDTAVFVTWDEGVGSSNQVATVAIAPSVHRGTRSATRFSHYSLLRTTEQLLGLRLLGGAATANSMRTAFNL